MNSIPIYYCNQCKKITEDIEQLYFVEEDSSRGFCSEACIEEYFTPIINYYEELEKGLRQEHQLETEACLKYVGNQKYMEAILSRPKEIWVNKNSLDEVIYTYICEFIDDSSQKFYLVLLCSVYNFKPSFIFMATTSYESTYIDEFRSGEKIDDVKEFLESSYDDEIQEELFDEELSNEIEQLKSSILADLMTVRNDNDIEMEQYLLYDDFLQDTLSEPDEVYINNEYDEEVSVYIKACEQKGVSFFYMAICRLLQSEDGREIVIPILTFPTIDGELSKHFKKGESLSKKLLN